MLETVAEKNPGLQEITICLFDSKIVISGPGVWKTVGEGVQRQWTNLDYRLVQLWESRSIRSWMVGAFLADQQGVRDIFEGLLPEITKRGITDIVCACPKVSIVTVIACRY